MKKILFGLIFSSMVFMIVSFTSDIVYSDGPYVFPEGKRMLVQWFESNKPKRKIINKKNQVKFKRFEPQIFDPSTLFSGYKSDEAVDFQGVENIAALSDVHGQFDLFIDVLTNNGIIDNQGNWSYGKGHFVIVGDIFDRGPKVTECLWFVYKLEQQAAAAGGRLHYLLGNHEIMILTGDLRYLHDKYKQTEQLLQLPYWRIFGPQSVLGAWLRTKPVTMSVNDIQFVHGGLSPALAASKFSVDEINSTFVDQIVDATVADSIYNDPRLKFLDTTSGPIWYRGYFNDPNLTEGQVDDVLKYFGKNKIVVGHTSFYKVETRFNNKIIVVDTSIKLGKAGEILLIENGAYFAGNEKGERRGIF